MSLPGTYDPTLVGQRIAALRGVHGLSQRRLAEAAGVSSGYIGLLERGRLASPGKSRLDAVARALDLHTSDALLLEDAPGNVLGELGLLRRAGARALPIYRWGSCGDPRDRESPPDPDRLEFPPPGRETLIGASGFGVVVKGESMAGRGIHDGDVVWVNPERPYQLGKVVLALVSHSGGDAGMVVKTYARTEVGDCLLSETPAGRTPLACDEFHIIGPVVGITSWRLPG